MFGLKNKDIEKAEDRVHEYQKWLHINLSDFRSSSCWTMFTYAWLWFLGIIATLVYAADTYTAAILLGFNRWPGQIEPAIPFKVSRWIFAICIILSWLLLGYHIFRAFRVMRRGSVAKDYLDPLAAQIQSMRSWRRFLVFAELTQSKKGADYVALFAYFQFQGSVRILLAQGPRQAINAITLYAVMQAKLLPNGEQAGTQFFTNVKVLAESQHEHAVILFTMLFTLVIWAFSALSLILSCLAYVTFLWHHVGWNLTHYCKRKIEKRLKKIVATTIEKELARQQRLRERAGHKRPGLFSRTNSSQTLVSRPTLPNVFNEKEDDAVSISTTVTRHNSAASSTSTLTSLSPPDSSFLPPAPPAAARVGTGHSQPRIARQPTLPCIEETPSVTEYPPSRKGSNSSFGSAASAEGRDDRPLLSRGTSGTTRTTQSSGTLPPSELRGGGYAGATDMHMQPRPLSLQRKPVGQGQVPPVRGMRPQPGYAPAQRGVYGNARGMGSQHSVSSGPKTFDAMGV